MCAIKKYDIMKPCLLTRFSSASQNSLAQNKTAETFSFLSQTSNAESLFIRFDLQPAFLST